MSATLKQIAEKAGVTQMTVSRVLNNANVAIRESTRKKVERIARELDYQPNYLAQSLKSSRTRIIGVTTSSGMMQQFGDRYTALVYSGIGERLHASGFKLLLQDFMERIDNSLIRKWVGSRLVEGIIFITYSHELDGLKKRILPVLQEAEVPVVLVHSLDEDLGMDAVGTDCRLAGRLMTEHLLDHGYASVGFAHSTAELPHTVSLYEGYRMMMQERGIKTDTRHIFKADGLELSSGYSLASDLAAGKSDLPRALIAADEKMALGMMRGFREGGVRVPEDVAVMGFGNLYDEARNVCGLSVATQPARWKGRTAADLLISKIEGTENKKEMKTAQPVLECATSCGCS